MKNSIKSNAKSNFHPENILRQGYDFKKLNAALPALKELIILNKSGKETIDFGDPKSVKLLNAAILKSHYQLAYWDIPKGYLCPPVPGRLDYLLHASDLLAAANSGKIPKGQKVKLLDIGTGANLIFPILARKHFGWDVIGTEVDQQAIINANEIIEKNNFHKGIDIRSQENPHKIFINILKPEDYIDLVVCNPPFHPSEQVARAGTDRKLKNLERSKIKKEQKPPKEKVKQLNFGGKKTELIYPGGELGFIQKMLEESKLIKNQVFWFTTLVSKESHLGRLKRKLEKLKPVDVKVVEMSQGQKSTRFLAWTFLDKKQRKVWREFRWK